MVFKRSVPPLLIAFLLLFFSSVSCVWMLPEAPTPISNSGMINIDTPQGPMPWSPYIGIHLNGNAIEGYRQALTTLVKRRLLKGVRLDLLYSNDPQFKMLTDLGLEIVGIIPNSELLQDPENMIDRYISLYPQVSVFEIGNEVTTIDGAGSMTIEQYMEAFKRIYLHVQDRGSVILITQSTSGIGSTSGSDELKRMVELGLKPENFSPEKVIVGVNLYTEDAINAYSSIRDQVGSYILWVMETGAIQPVNHIPHVKYFYPRLANSVHATRVYWYVLWGGDSGPETGFSLIQNPYDPAKMTYSPLYKALSGIQ